MGKAWLMRVTALFFDLYIKTCMEEAFVFVLCLVGTRRSYIAFMTCPFDFNDLILSKNNITKMPLVKARRKNEEEKNKMFKFVKQCVG